MPPICAMVLAAPRWNMNTSTLTSAISHGSAPSPVAELLSSRARRGRMWGNVVLYSGQLSEIRKACLRKKQQN